MTITINQKIPSITLKRLGDSGMEDLNIAEYIAHKKVIIFGVPGAFTPSCDQKHLPGYIANAEGIKAKGVDEIICIAVNDPFVMKYWAETSGANGKVTLIPDGNAELTRALGLDFDGSGFGLATRCKRFSMIVENGVVISLDIEAAPSDVALSSAETCMLKLAA
jgi:peroxiredoxin